MVAACQGRLSLVAIQRCGSDIGPHVRENEVLPGAQSLGIHHSQIELRRRDALLRKGAEESCCLGIVTTVIRKLRLFNRSCDRDGRPGHDQEDCEKKTLHHPSTFQRSSSITNLTM